MERLWSLAGETAGNQWQTRTPEHRDLSIHYGHYLTPVTRMPLANPRRGGARTVEVVKTEEKGSDVDLATYLLLDAFQRTATWLC